MLVVARHGETLGNVTGKLTSYTDIDLTEKGHQQACELSSGLLRVTWDDVYCSPLLRAQNTVAMLAPNHPPLIDQRLVEFHFGSFEGISSRDLLAGPQADNYKKWMTGQDVDNGGESWKSLGRRAQEMLDLYMTYPAHSHVLYSTHGYVLRAMVCVALGAPLSAIQKMRVDNCRLAVFAHERGTLRLAGFNGVALAAEEYF